MRYPNPLQATGSKIALCREWSSMYHLPAGTPPNQSDLEQAHEGQPRRGRGWASHDVPSLHEEEGTQDGPAVTMKPTVKVPVSPREQSQARGMLPANLDHIHLTSLPPPKEVRAMEENAEPSNPTTPRRLAVYNDGLTMTAQPQTPGHLPDARHRSRIDGPYAAPTGRRHEQVVAAMPTTRGRGISPVGLRAPGFRGLYGGAENTAEGIFLEET
ncbi:hypothetical protein B0T10DRAFT_61319 [Thelonectria olida]|uniref:Uncharacterized protein n=1 Tax=Thelonectria olida TaxID=1576542 RepID=A0A9P9AS68_9HYPO|nr:hypothetical protein B0T10DRAFT_61319 [Thelonectria olida]